jgi:hypothetical protein
MEREERLQGIADSEGGGERGRESGWEGGQGEAHARQRAAEREGAGVHVGATCISPGRIMIKCCITKHLCLQSVLVNSSCFFFFQLLHMT